jgi:CIC family chloride channel protein
METKQLALDGEIFTHRREGNILSSLSLADLVERDRQILHPEQPFADLIRLLEETDRQIFAVVDVKWHLQGVIALNDVRGMLFHPELYAGTLLKDILREPPAVLAIDTRVSGVMSEFDATKARFLPVVDKENRFVGFISRTRLFEAYRSKVDQHRDIYDED